MHLAVPSNSDSKKTHRKKLLKSNPSANRLPPALRTHSACLLARVRQVEKPQSRCCFWGTGEPPAHSRTCLGLDGLSHHVTIHKDPRCCHTLTPVANSTHFSPFPCQLPWEQAPHPGSPLPPSPLPPPTITPPIPSTPSIANTPDRNPIPSTGNPPPQSTSSAPLRAEHPLYTGHPHLPPHKSRPSPPCCHLPAKRTSCFHTPFQQRAPLPEDPSITSTHPPALNNGHHPPPRPLNNTHPPPPNPSQ